MQIVPYDKVNKEKIFWLNYFGLQYDFPLSDIQSMRDNDDRYSPEFAWYITENDSPVSQAGLLYYLCKSTIKTEEVGIPFMICTHPGHTRKGYAKALMDFLHNKMRRKKVQFSILTTSRFRGSYQLYRNLGYDDFIRIKYFYGTLPENLDNNFKYRSAEKNEFRSFYKIFNKNFHDKFGFVIRPENFVFRHQVSRKISLNHLHSLIYEESLVGYAWANLESNPVDIIEIVTDQGALLDWVSLLTRGKKFRMFMPHSFLNEEYTENNLKVIEGWGVVMIKDLEEKKSIQEIKDYFGLEKDFIALPLDLY
ncbi:MAG: GNAT family N-acetyltransferase [Candidatus Kariarchaeaceae archaeon]|jgi:GNAT superfamily N-acetyltransferase